MPLLFVTWNPYKLDDARRLLPWVELEHSDFDVPEIQSMNPREIIEHKLQFAFEKMKQPCFVMDASLFLNAFGWFPGPFIKWWFEKTVGAEKTCQIVKTLGDNRCTWTTTLGYFDGTKSHFIEASVAGYISESPRGTNGYHWDTIFIPDADTRTLAEMTFEEKQLYGVTSKIFSEFKKLL